jgi:hypothetical protein
MNFFAKNVSASRSYVRSALKKDHIVISKRLKETHTTTKNKNTKASGSNNFEAEF